MKWGTRVTALAAATALSGIGFAGAADAAGPPVYSKYSVSGTTHIAKPHADLDLGPGQFDMYTLVGPYTFYGTITLPPVQVTGRSRVSAGSAGPSRSAPATPKARCSAASPARRPGR
ncbi:hypothetical protein [Amycolatopsis sp. NPDC021455]|uniref:hypothetical protein n=1 Tax=Amycolatopsis sp. NPDC021455 TaxID=3154901 RepID=UPI0033C42EC3